LAEEKTYEVSEEVREMAQTVFQENKVKIVADFEELDIIYMKQYPNISKTTAAQCIKPSKLLKHFSESDIIIQVSGDLWDGLPDETKYILLLHEMKHIGINYKKNGARIIYLEPHNVQDFSDIIREYGVDWIENIKSVVASINDFENGEEEKVRI